MNVKENVHVFLPLFVMFSVSILHKRPFFWPFFPLKITLIVIFSWWKSLSMSTTLLFTEEFVINSDVTVHLGKDQEIKPVLFFRLSQPRPEQDVSVSFRGSLSLKWRQKVKRIVSFILCLHSSPFFPFHARRIPPLRPNVSVLSLFSSYPPLIIIL